MTKWEEFGRWVMQSLWDGATEIDVFEVQDIAEDIGIIRSVPYDPDIHGDGPADFDTMPGELIYEYTDECKPQEPKA